MRKFFTLADAIVPMYHPRLLVETAVAQGAQVGALLEGSDVNSMMLSSPDARISYLQFGVITGNAVRLTGNPALGIDFGRRIQPSHLGMVGVVIANSPNARESLEAGLKYSCMLSPCWELNLSIRDGRAILKAREVINLGPFLVFATDSLLCAINTVVSCVIGHTAPVIEVRLNFSKPAYAARYSEICSAPFYFDREETEIIFDGAWLNEPIKAADPLTAKLAERFCASQLPSNVSIVGLVGEVRRFLYAATGKYPDPVEIAKALQTSPRSLRRGLQEMRTSYRVLLDEARRAHAVEYLLCTEMTAEQIASLLGFGDARSFRRAFKRWTGQTVAGYRDAESC